MNPNWQQPMSPMIMAQYLNAVEVMFFIDVTMVFWDKNDFTK
jgi:hypothetical protein